MLMSAVSGDQKWRRQERAFWAVMALSASYRAAGSEYDFSAALEDVTNEVTKYVSTNPIVLNSKAMMWRALQGLASTGRKPWASNYAREIRASAGELPDWAPPNCREIYEWGFMSTECRPMEKVWRALWQFRSSPAEILAARSAHPRSFDELADKVRFAAFIGALENWRCCARDNECDAGRVGDYFGRMMAIPDDKCLLAARDLVFWPGYKLMQPPKEPRDPMQRQIFESLISAPAFWLRALERDAKRLSWPPKAIAA
ncbi:hypothetical protein [Rhizomicrobium electricum]|uniref:Uncharacterized protein n=1 Tax=Rhizomicrobium electricum TaxID=480070 RepID=A0ABN1FDK3_9PROT|nr:hypothetical protein [Rhizomicrobium electricum]NIJ50838.1 hypothetical protein [Rhizomicrobium electricum]